MKTALFALALAFTAIQSQAAELQIFRDYKGYNDYSRPKLISTTEAPLSASLILNTANGACWKTEDGAELLDLLRSMLSIYTTETGNQTEVTRFNIEASQEDGKTYVSYEVKVSTDKGLVIWTMPKMRKCIR